jgi:hypothetical protein
MAQLFNVIGFRLETSDWIDFNEERVAGTASHL